MFTKLMAVNRILRGNKEDPVNSLDDTGINPAKVAEAVLDEASFKIQSEGHQYNTTIRELFPDGATNEIIVDDSVITVSGQGKDGGRSLVKRQGKLYDNNRDTFSFEDIESVCVQIIYSLDFEDLPPSERISVTDQAAWEYQQVTNGDATQGRVLELLALQSKILGKSADARRQDNNWLDDSAVSRSIARRSEDWNLQGRH